MMVTHKIVQQEATELKNILNSGDVQIPDFWSCAWPCLALILWLVCIPLVAFGITTGISDDEAFSSIFDAFFGFLLSMMLFSMRSFYLSIPASFRNTSKVLGLLVKKARTYILVAAILNLLCMVFAIRANLGTLGYHVPNIFILCIIGFVFSADIGRYRLSAFTAALELIKSRKQGGE
ncbi:hypothetical protein ACTVR5_12095 [Serratia marcescens]|uniref:hypothetical protein n=1 Tax=Serratia marcescens TaxID=615 RepID=UPI003FA7C41B